MFDVNSSNPDRNNILDNHIDRMKKLGYHYSYWVKDIDILYNTSVGKIYFMVDGLEPSENLNKYLRRWTYGNPFKGYGKGISSGIREKR